MRYGQEVPAGESRNPPLLDVGVAIRAEANMLASMPPFSSPSRTGVENKTRENSGCGTGWVPSLVSLVIDHV